jgi:hypothetical protein
MQGERKGETLDERTFMLEPKLVQAIAETSPGGYRFVRVLSRVFREVLRFFCGVFFDWVAPGKEPRCECPSFERCGTGKGYLNETRFGSVRPPGLRIRRAEG